MPPPQVGSDSAYVRERLLGAAKGCHVPDACEESDGEVASESFGRLVLPRASLESGFWVSGASAGSRRDLVRRGDGPMPASQTGLGLEVCGLDTRVWRTLPKPGPDEGKPQMGRGEEVEERSLHRGVLLLDRRLDLSHLRAYQHIRG